jgi:hypothetical protein
MGFLSKSLLRFAESQMNTEEVRNRVYYSWVVFRHLTFDVPKLARLLNQHQVEVTVMVGRFDKVIPPSMMDSFVKKLNHGKLEVLESGHHQVLRASESLIKDKSSGQSGRPEKN